MASHNDLGKRGEDIAREYLENLGYQILKMNWRHGRAEVDVIANQGGTIIFVEVKTRSSTDYGEPEDFVNIKKERQLEYASSAYIEMNNHEGEIRFDVIAIVFENKHLYKINHIEDAFWPS
ncbi:YraN family protein [Pedobacter sp. B4-66]|uniref:YraN family protein n=1 Tax=Pedobacter sp. B4-66 TaxID=2817280 RepID=UPI001BD97D96|nr:YraN family protein [Pedobacter sp. B4-66]